MTDRPKLTPRELDVSGDNEGVRVTAPYYSDDTVALHHGDALTVLRTLPDESVNCCVTSPPYFGLRDYGHPDQIGAEKSPAQFVEALRAVFAEVRRVLADDGTFWLNLGDSYAGSSASGPPSSSSTLRGNGHVGGGPKQQEGAGRPSFRIRRDGVKVMPPSGVTAREGLPAKNLLGIPWRVAFALQDDGWILRNAIVWSKPNAMPESVTDRLSTRYEMLFMFSKNRKYWFDLDPIREARAREDRSDAIAAVDSKQRTDVGSATRQGKNAMSVWNTGTYKSDGRNPGDVWDIPTSPFPGSHFAVFPPELPRRCIVAGCKPGGTVLDPFHGSGTTGMVATRNGRKYVGIELNRKYLDLSLRTRLADGVLDFG